MDVTSVPTTPPPLLTRSVYVLVRKHCLTPPSVEPALVLTALSARKVTTTTIPAQGSQRAQLAQRVKNAKNVTAPASVFAIRARAVTYLIPPLIPA